MMVNKAILNLFHAWLVAESINLSLFLTFSLSVFLSLSFSVSHDPNWLSNHVSTLLLFPSRFNPPSKRLRFDDSFITSPGDVCSFSDRPLSTFRPAGKCSDRRSTVHCDRLRGVSTRITSFGITLGIGYVRLIRAARRVASRRKSSSCDPGDQHIRDLHMIDSVDSDLATHVKIQQNVAVECDPRRAFDRSTNGDLCYSLHLQQYLC